MANELNISSPSGNTLYAIVRRASDSKVWQTTTSTFVTWVNANVANYDVALTDRSGDYYTADFPSGITAVGSYAINYYLQAGAAPAITDDPLEAETISWDGGSSTPSPGDPGTNAGTIGNLVTILRVAGRSVGLADNDDTVYSLSEKHLAIRGCLNHFIRATQCSDDQHDTVAVSTDDTSLDFGSLTGFHRERVLTCWIDGEEPVQIVPLQDVIAKRRDSDADTAGVPTLLAFDTPTTAMIWATADDDYTLDVIWYPPLVAFTVGDSDANDTVVNMPYDLAEAAIRTGGVAWLQSGSVENLPLTNPMRMAYLQLIAENMGAGRRPVLTRRGRRSPEAKASFNLWAARSVE